MFLFLVWAVFPTPKPTVSGDGKVLTITGKGSITQEIARSEGVYNSIIEVIVTEAEVLADSAFNQFQGMRSITLPKQMTSIGYNCFYFCKSLERFTVPEGVTSIFSGTFSECSKLQFVHFSSTVQTIHQNTFYRCFELVNFSVSLDNSYFSTDESKHFLLDKIGNVIYFAAPVKTLVIPSKPTIINSYFISGVFPKVIDFSQSHIEVIRIHAFCETTINELIFPQTLKHLEAAFKTTAVTTISVPESLEYFEESTLQEVSGLKNFEVGENPKVFEVIEGTIYNKQKTKIFFVPSTQSILTIPELVESVDGPLVRSSNIVAVNVESGNQNYSSIDSFLFNKKGDKLIACPGGLKRAVIPSQCKSIEEFAFREVLVEEVVFNEGLISIGRDCFDFCPNLRNIILSSTIQELGGYAFMGIKAPNCELVFSADLYSIGFKGFVMAQFKTVNLERCTKLTSLNDSIFREAVIGNLILHQNFNKIGNQAFMSSSISSIISFPNLVTIGDQAFINSNIELISFNGSTIKIIEDSVFEGSTITEFTLPDSVEELKTAAFKGCKKMRVLRISENSKLKRIESGALSNCESITEVFIGSKVEFIANGAFSGCISLKAFRVSSANSNFLVDSRAEFLRKGKRSALHSFAGGWSDCDIPAEINEILPMAFLECTKLEAIVFEDGCGVDTIKESTFKDCSLLSKVEFGIASKIGCIEGAAFSGCKSLTSIEFGESLKDIRSSAFSNCLSLVSITLPSGLTSIGTGAFSGCSSLREIIFCGLSASTELSGASKESIFGGTPCEIVFVPIGHTGNLFCGMSTVEAVDKDCQFRTAKFSAGTDSQIESSLLVASLFDDSDIE